MVATPVVRENQLTELVMFCVELSLYVPVAVNCSVAPFVILGFAGVTAIDDSVGPVTLRMVEPVTAPDIAWIIDMPAPTAVARPVEEIVATAGVAEDQATELLRFWVLPSLKVPVAVNCCVAFLARVGFAGVTARDFSVAAATVKVTEPLTVPDEAVISVVPAVFAVTKPAPLTVATLVF